MPRLTHDPVTGRAIHPMDDYDYVTDPRRSDERRHLPNDTASVSARQKEANDRGEPYWPTKWECVHLGKWWNVPEEEHAALIAAETADHAWHDIIENKLASEPSLYHNAPGEIPTPWDGSLAEHATWGNIVTTTRIGIQWLRLNAEAFGRATGTAKNISSTMRRLGWTLKRTRVQGMATLPNVWIKPSWVCSTSSDSIVNNGDDDDIPF